MNRTPIEDKTAIAGIAWTKISRASGKSVMALAAEACLGAIEDAGLTVRDVDGFVEYQSNDSVGTMDVADVLGVPRINWYTDIRGGGNYGSGSVMLAAMAVASGACEVCVVYRALNGRSGHRFGRDAPTTQGRREQWMLPYGYMVPPQWLAMWCRTHMAKYGTTYEHLGAIAVTQRHNATLNPRAIFQRPMTMEDYLAARWINDPFRLFDCTAEVDGACAVVVTTAERARSLRHKPVYIKGFAYGTQGRPSWEHWDDMSEMYARYIGQQLWQRTGLTAKDVDVAEIYDCFTYSLLGQLEGYGFCKTGEGGPFCASGAISLTGQIPTNTHGGLLSEGYIHGMNHNCEAVSQLRGDAGPRQVKGARVAMVTGGAGPHGGALIYHTK
ncbi:MAG: nonspecific lipid-transfer protein [Chloroflexi bacterium]|nr:nonspecific lipid-transfer protein [Chloroflexota bacterium]